MFKQTGCHSRMNCLSIWANTYQRRICCHGRADCGLALLFKGIQGIINNCEKGKHNHVKKNWQEFKDMTEES